MTTTLQGNPSTRTILKFPDGTWMYSDRCCCVQLKGACCCDVNLEPWFTPPISVTILDLTHPSAGFMPVDLDLSCLVGTWVCPFLKFDELLTTCTWQNTFSAGDGPDDAVFKITIEITKSSDIDLSTNLDYSVNPGHSDTKLADKTSLITIEMLSCRDCKSKIMQNKPEFILDHKTYNCGASDDPSWNPYAGDVCGCAEDGFQYKNIDGSWSSAYLGMNPASLNASQRHGFHGYCWTNPDATYNYGGVLELFDPRMVDENGTEYTCHLAFLDRSIVCHRDSDNRCRWLPDHEDTSTIDYIASDLVVDGVSCQTSIRLQSNYLAGVDGFTCRGITFNAVTAPHLTYVGCLDQAPWVWATLATASSGGHTYKIQIKAGWFPSRKENCVMHASVLVGSDPCKNNQSFNVCACNQEECGGDPYPPGELFTAILYKRLLPTTDTPSNIITCLRSASDPPTEPGIDTSSGGDPGGEDVGASSSNCECPDADVCSCAKITVNIPVEIKANDYAPAGARYEVLVTVTTNSRNEEQDVTTYSLIYHKQLGAEGETIDATYPMGSWVLEHLPDDKLLGALGSFTECVHKDRCSEIVKAIKDSYSFAPGRVPAETLYPAGIWSTHAFDPADQFATIEVQLRSRLGLGTNPDPCCSCVDNKSSDPIDFDRYHCNICNCAYDGSSEGSTLVCTKPIHITPNDSKYCCPCYGLSSIAATITKTVPYLRCGTGLGSPPCTAGPCLKPGTDGSNPSDYVYPEYVNYTATTTMDCEWTQEVLPDPSEITNECDPICGDIDGSGCIAIDTLYSDKDTCQDIEGNYWYFRCTQVDTKTINCAAPGLFSSITYTNTWDCNEQRWMTGVQDITYNICDGGSGYVPGDVRYLNTCEGEITEIIQYYNDCHGTAECIDGVLRGNDNINQTTVYNYGKIPCIRGGCYGQTSSGSGGPQLGSDCHYVPGTTDGCVGLSFIFKWRYRLHFDTLAEAETWVDDHNDVGNNFTATAFLYPGNGTVICKVITAEYEIASAPPWDGESTYVYIDFSMNLTGVDAIGNCADITNPYIQIGEICPTIPGGLVDRQVTGSMYISTDTSCEDPDCFTGGL